MGLFFFSLNSPDVFRVAGKFDLLDRILPKLKRTNHRCDITVFPLLRHIFIVNCINLGFFKFYFKGIAVFTNDVLNDHS